MRIGTIIIASALSSFLMVGCASADDGSLDSVYSKCWTPSDGKSEEFVGALLIFKVNEKYYSRLNSLKCANDLQTMTYLRDKDALVISAVTGNKESAQIFPNTLSHGGGVDTVRYILLIEGDGEIEYEKDYTKGEYIISINRLKSVSPLPVTPQQLWEMTDKDQRKLFYNYWENSSILPASQNK